MYVPKHWERQTEYQYVQAHIDDGVTPRKGRAIDTMSGLNQVPKGGEGSATGQSDDHAGDPECGD